MFTGKKIEANHKAVRITSNIMGELVEQMLCNALLTVIIFHRKDYGSSALLCITLLIMLTLSLANHALSEVLISAIERPNLVSQETPKQREKLLEEARGPTAYSRVTYLIINSSFCTALLVAAYYGLLDSEASSRAAKFIGALTISMIMVDLLGSLFFSGLQNFTGKFPKQKEKVAEEDSLISTIVAQVRVNNYYKEQAPAPAI